MNGSDGNTLGGLVVPFYSVRYGKRGIRSVKNEQTRFAFAVIAALVLSACATTQQASDDQKIKMEPVLVKADKDPLTGLDGYDAQVLLELGNQLYAKGDHDKAIEVYDKMVAEFPDSKHIPSAQYNAGLAYEQLSELDDAVKRFDMIIEHHRDSKSFKDAYFRKAFVLGKLKRWVDVADTFWAIRQLDGLSPMDELEARVGQGVGMFMQNDYATAEVEFMSAIRFFESQSKLEYLPADYWIGQSRFYLGEIYAREFERTKLSAPKVDRNKWVEAMGKELEEKCRLLLRAQNNFIRTIRVGHSGWATAAGFRIGSLYEKLYDDLLEVPVPPDLDKEEKSVYLELLRKRVSVLVVKAIKVYEQSLQMAQRVGEKNEWVDQTSKSLERMKSLYLAELEG